MAEEQIEQTREKLPYETPVVVDLSTIQRGEGGLTGNCTNGSSPAGYCFVGSLPVTPP
jgi:hypothetical protein